MSNSLVWELVKRNSSYLVKRDGALFATEPGNLTCLNRKRFSGLANKRAVNIKYAKGGKKIEVHLKRRPARRHPAKAWRVSKIKTNKHSVAAVRNILKHGGYRRDLIGPAVKRASILLRAMGRAHGRKMAAKKTEKK
ncbi:putative ribosomal protein L28 [Monocercomonoides exilis]|uniref:putative ribosomal protein L28 n=1 Tax=Monocercomonoides exilis TaxID=2049356 RepID=UPI0035598B37|nr:putative ribosomal protein L28 [Monocercomonoides exilis]|eukprot:MONOS_4846.1-p1 / transcript=MONOS_4846.1 / gene=MONOS_4846 / organism=Monocercomonoides_exilis_PA203 / gene_product=ribosomal protein L28 / transcript_product=ribosomal protein L28 / location=Mono_scaffold00135:17898-18308(-) / protein_length=136 / sequence_SO=supercontig / SO=protein_coding / is_pseudo=false